MTLKKVGIKVNPETWEALGEKAKEVRHSRNNFINLLFDAVIKKDADELVRLIYPTKSSP